MTPHLMPPNLQVGSSTGPLVLEDSTTTPHEMDERRIERSTSTAALRYWCYALHAILFLLQIVLLAMLKSHPEHNVSMTLDNSVITIGLSALLQAFYTVGNI